MEITCFIFWCKVIIFLSCTCSVYFFGCICLFVQCSPEDTWDKARSLIPEICCSSLIARTAAASLVGQYEQKFRSSSRFQARLSETATNWQTTSTEVVFVETGDLRGAEWSYLCATGPRSAGCWQAWQLGAWRGEDGRLATTSLEVLAPGLLGSCWGWRGMAHVPRLVGGNLLSLL